MAQCDAISLEETIRVLEEHSVDHLIPWRSSVLTIDNTTTTCLSRPDLSLHTAHEDDEGPSHTIGRIYETGIVKHYFEATLFTLKEEVPFETMLLPQMWYVLAPGGHAIVAFKKGQQQVRNTLPNGFMVLINMHDTHTGYDLVILKAQKYTHDVVLVD
jgi:hypothetical protein